MPLPRGRRKTGVRNRPVFMVAVESAGVLFTANPVTGCRTEMLVEAAGGTGVVDGDAAVTRTAPPPDLRAVGERVQRHFGTPQDVEWARTLFPLPPRTPDLRVHPEFGHVQGMLRPVTPMGMSTLWRTVAAMVAALGVRAEIVDIGGRLYGARPTWQGIPPPGNGWSG